MKDSIFEYSNITQIGRNITLPRFVRYRSKKNMFIYVDIIDQSSGLVSQISVRSRCLVDPNIPAPKLIPIINISSSEYFTYQDKSRFQVPKRIFTNEDQYQFDGETITAALCSPISVQHAGIMFSLVQFDAGRGFYLGGQNDYGSSMLRYWLNGVSCNRLSYQRWFDYSFEQSITAGNMKISGSKLIQDTIQKNHFRIIDSANLVWVYKCNNRITPSLSDWRSGKTLDKDHNEMIIDKFFLFDEFYIKVAKENGSLQRINIPYPAWTCIASKNTDDEYCSVQCCQISENKDLIMNYCNSYGSIIPLVAFQYES